MKLAFWKGRKPRPRAPARGAGEPDFEASPEDPDAQASEALRLRVRARRRLIGAGALLLLVVVVVPMILDPAPRPIADNIPIELPSDRTPFAPRLAPAANAALPAGAVSGTIGVAPTASPGGGVVAAAVPAAPGSAADAAAVAGSAPAGAGEPVSAGADASKANPGKTDAAKADGAKTDAHRAGHGRIFVQAAAMANENAAQELAGRLAKSGLASFVERTDTSDGVRFRVRLGPFASRGEAERSRARLRALGVNANIVGA